MSTLHFKVYNYLQAMGLDIHEEPFSKTPYASIQKLSLLCQSMPISVIIFWTTALHICVQIYSYVYMWKALFPNIIYELGIDIANRFLSLITLIMYWGKQSSSNTQGGIYKHTSSRLYKNYVAATNVMKVKKIGIIAGFEHMALTFWDSVLPILPPRLTSHLITECWASSEVARASLRCTRHPDTGV